MPWIYHNFLYCGKCHIILGMLTRGKLLRWAVRRGYRIITAILIHIGADAKARDKDGKTPLHLLRWTAAVPAFVRAGADINAQDKDGNTPLHLLARSGADMVSALISAGADINARNKNGNTPVHAASSGLSFRTVPVLVEAGADVNAKNVVQNTPLHLAAEFCELSLVSDLLRAGADVNARNILQQTPLHLTGKVCMKGGCEALIQMGADVNATDIKKYTPLHYAANNGNTRAATALLRAGANPNAQTEGGITPAVSAMKGAHLEILDALKNAGANIKEDEIQRVREIVVAIRKAYPLSISDAISEDTLLHTWAAWGYTDLVKKFIEDGGYVNAIDGYGNTPLALARKGGHIHTAEILVNAGAVEVDSNSLAAQQAVADIKKAAQQASGKMSGSDI